MGHNTYYHNVTRKIYNEKDVINLMNNSNEEDLILVSEEGSALVREITAKEMEDIQITYANYYDDDDDSWVWDK